MPMRKDAAERGEDADLADGGGAVEAESATNDQDQPGQQQSNKAADDRVEPDRVDQVVDGHHRRQDGCRREAAPQRILKVTSAAHRGDVMRMARTGDQGPPSAASALGSVDPWSACRFRVLEAAGGSDVGTIRRQISRRLRRSPLAGGVRAGEAEGVGRH